MAIQLAIIGGSGLYSLGEDFALEEMFPRETAHGETSADILLGKWHDKPLAFLPRHGPKHGIPPHRINYRANIWALRQLGVKKIIAVNAVGGISDNMPPLTMALPNQIIDYSSGREHSFFDGEFLLIEEILIRAGQLILLCDRIVGILEEDFLVY